MRPGAALAVLGGSVVLIGAMVLLAADSGPATDAGVPPAAGVADRRTAPPSVGAPPAPASLPQPPEPGAAPPPPTDPARTVHESGTGGTTIVTQRHADAFDAAWARFLAAAAVQFPPDPAEVEGIVSGRPRDESDAVRSLWKSWSAYSQDDVARENRIDAALASVASLGVAMFEASRLDACIAALDAVAGDVRAATRSTQALHAASVAIALRAKRHESQATLSPLAARTTAAPPLPDWLRDAADRARSLSWPAKEAEIALYAGEYHQFAGDLAGAQPWFRRAESLARASAPHLVGEVVSRLAACIAASATPAERIVQLDRLHDDLVRDGFPGPAGRVSGLLAQAYLEIHDEASATRIAARGEAELAADGETGASRALGVQRSAFDRTSSAAQDPVALEARAADLEARGRSGEAAVAWLNLCAFADGANRPADGLRWSERAHSAATRAGAAAEVLAARFHTGVFLHQSDRHAEAVKLLSEVLRDGPGHVRPEILTRARVAFLAARSRAEPGSVSVGEYARAIRDLVEGDLARAAGAAPEFLRELRASARRLADGVIDTVLGAGDEIRAAGRTPGTDDATIDAILWFAESTRARGLAEQCVSLHALRRAAAAPKTLLEYADASADVEARRNDLWGEWSRGSAANPARLTHLRAAFDSAYRRWTSAFGLLGTGRRTSAVLEYPEPATLAQIRDGLGRDDAFVHILVTDRRACAIVVRAAAANVVDLGESGPVVAAATAAEETKAGSVPALRALHDRVVAPLLPSLAGVRRVLLCPDERLATAPFDAALDPAGRAWIDSVELTYEPSASTWLALRREQSSRAGRPRRDVVVGAIDYGTTSSGTAHAWSPLPGAAAEFAAVAKLLPGATRLRSADATPEAVLRELSRDPPTLGVVHLACHATASGEPGLQALVLAGDAQLPMERLLDARMDADLVVLSACATAAGADVRGEGRMSFVPACLAAGALRTAVTNWRIDDAGTDRFMQDFHEERLRGTPASAALRAAKLRACSGGTAARVWAAFTVWGLPD